MIMSHFQLNQHFFDEPMRLSEYEKADPLEVFDGFFTDYKLGEIRELNQQIDHICLSTDSPPFQDFNERARLLMYRQDEERLLEAALLLLRNSGSSPKQPPTENSLQNPLQSVIGEIDLADVQKRIIDIQYKVAQLCNIIVTAYGANIDKMLQP
jgi:hypothetical protein